MWVWLCGIKINFNFNFWWFIYKFDMEFEWVFEWFWDSKFYWKFIGNEKIIIITFKTLFKMLLFIGYNINSFQIEKLRK